MDDAYRQAKEDFITGMTGSSLGKINKISLNAPATILLFSVIVSRFYPDQSIYFVFQFLLLVIPILLSITTFAEKPLLLVAGLGLPALLLTYLFPPKQVGTPLPSSRPSSASKLTVDTGSQDEVKPDSLPRPLPAVSTYRAHLLLLTILAILAVDFPAFPRSLAKCENAGASLMDLGVGSFVFAGGLASVGPILRDPSGYFCLGSGMIKKLVKDVKKAIPIILMGLVRVLLVKSSGYNEHVTEYGVHWSFYFTLAMLPLMTTALHPFLAHSSIMVVGACVAVAHQLSLHFSLESYIHNAPRVSIFSENKEGLVSLSGYLAIYLIGLATGALVLPPSPSYFRKYRRSGVINAGVSTGSLSENNRLQNQDVQRPLQMPSSVPSVRTSGYTPSPLSSPNRRSAPLSSFSQTQTRVEETPEDRPLLVQDPDSDFDSDSDPDEQTAGLPANVAPSTVAGKTSAMVALAAPRENAKTATELAAHAALWWILLAACAVFLPHPLTTESNPDGGIIARSISRRLANLPYILWVAAFNTSFILLYLLIDMAYQPSAPKKGKRSRSIPTPHSGGTALSRGTAQQLNEQTDNHNVVAPELLQAINKNGLFVFLLANVVMGLINFSMNTLNTQDELALVVISAYAFVVCWVAWGFRKTRIW